MVIHLLIYSQVKTGRCLPEDARMQGEKLNGSSGIVNKMDNNFYLNSCLFLNSLNRDDPGPWPRTRVFAIEKRIHFLSSRTLSA